jgi:hypothetical protein
MLASNRLRSIVLPILASAALAACGGEPPQQGGLAEAVSADEGAPGSGEPGHELDGKGSFSCDFQLTSAIPLSQVPPVIERDRMFMADQPGMIRKHLPILVDASGDVYSGGRYLFDTHEDAKSYADWVEHGYVLDGVQFLQRPYFLDPACYAWRVVGARGFASIEHQLVVRVERFQVPADPGDLDGVYHAAVAQAASRGLTAVWLVEDHDDGLTQLVYFIDRVDPPDPTTPDFASLGALAGAPALGDAVAPASWTRIFDRTSWILTDWFPYAFADRGRPSLWPYSPPFPGPSCGDGVCEPSRGETGASCPADCPVHCGDGVCQPAEGETDDNCPSDCRL